MFSIISIRILDIILSLLLLMIFSPIFILVIIFLYIYQGKPIFYISKRIGKEGINFNIIKFRTMVNKTNENEKDSITKIGKYLRRSSLDEIPQLLNVLINDMSMVGPRPLPLNIEKNIDKNYIKLRRTVKPGITGYAQILYKKKKRSWDEKIKLDLQFIEKNTLAGYLKILLLTFPVLIKRFIFNSKGDSL